MDLTVKPSQLTAVVNRAINTDQPLFIWGPPGIGKSDIVAQLANNRNALLIDIRLASYEPTDIRGYPYRDPETNTMCWSPPADLPDEDLAEQYNEIIVFLDELNSAVPTVQAAAYQLILNRRIGQYKLPSNVRLIAAGNRDGDRGVTFRMPAPLANRFRHVELTHNFQDWFEWAEGEGVHSDVLSYLHGNQRDLFTFNPKAPETVFASPRTWKMLSDLLHGAEGEELFIQEIGGTVGEGIAYSFLEYKKYADIMPVPEDILAGKVVGLAPELSNNTSVKYSLVLKCTAELEDSYESCEEKEFKERINHLLSYGFHNFDPEINVILMRKLTKANKFKLQVRNHFNADNLKIFRDRYIKLINPED